MLRFLSQEAFRFFDTISLIRIGTMGNVNSQPSLGSKTALTITFTKKVIAGSPYP